jgi:hypothetical protein
VGFVLHKVALSGRFLNIPAFPCHFSFHHCFILSLSGAGKIDSFTAEVPRESQNFREMGCELGGWCGVIQDANKPM